MTIMETGTIPTVSAGFFLRAARESAGLTQQQLADALQVDRTTIRDAENNLRKPRHERVVAWAIACGVQVAWLQYHVDLAEDPSVTLDLSPAREGGDSKPRRYPLAGGGVSPLSQSVKTPLTLDRRSRAAWELAA